MRTELWVVVPAYNEAGFIAGLLTALAAQTDPDFDVWFVDNNSTDGSAGVIRSYASSRGLTRWQVIDEPEKGTGAARSHRSVGAPRSPAHDPRAGPRYVCAESRRPPGRARR